MRIVAQIKPMSSYFIRLCIDIFAFHDLPYRGVKLDSATVPYVHRIAVAFFGNLVETSVEFRKAFAGLPAMSSSFLTWLEEEVNMRCHI